MMPPTPPMSDAPPPPLPVNPRMSQPSPKNSFQAQQEADLLGLQEMKNTPAGGTEDLNDQNMGMGANMGGFRRGWGKLLASFELWALPSAGLPVSPERRRLLISQVNRCLLRAALDQGR
jgi:hypothetical protein